MIVNACYMAPPRTNVGDRFTHPVDYFSWGEDVRKTSLVNPDIALLSTASLVIIGGGGIVRHPKRNDWGTIKQIVDAMPNAKPIVIWGMGINDQGRLDTLYDDALSYFERRPNVLVGLRDGFYDNYLPCASCMRPEFDKDYTLEHRVGVYTHESRDIPLNHPKLSNRFEGDPEEHLRQAIAFLGSSAIVVTNSYHGAYWATLLGRRVVVTQASSNKFVGLKHTPVIVQDPRNIANHIDYLENMTRRYQSALAESRRLNIDFFERVSEFRQTLVKSPPTIAAT